MPYLHSLLNVPIGDRKGCRTLGILIDDMLRVWSVPSNAWMGGPWRPLRLLYGAREPNGRQAETYMIHLYVSVRYLWLLVNEFLCCLAGLSELTQDSPIAEKKPRLVWAGFEPPVVSLTETG